MLRFDNLNSIIPSGSYVQSANLSITFSNIEDVARVIGHYIRVPWFADVPNGIFNGNDAVHVNWMNRTATARWTVPGALGDGTDLVAGKSFAFPPCNPSFSSMRLTAPLDIGVIQSWIDDPGDFILSLDQLHHSDIFLQPTIMDFD